MVAMILFAAALWAFGVRIPASQPIFEKRYNTALARDLRAFRTRNLSRGRAAVEGHTRNSNVVTHMGKRARFESLRVLGVADRRCGRMALKPSGNRCGSSGLTRQGHFSDGDSPDIHVGGESG